MPTLPLSSRLGDANMLFDSEHDAAFAELDTSDEKPEAIILYAFGAIAIVLVGMLFGLGHFI